MVGMVRLHSGEIPKVMIDGQYVFAEGKVEELAARILSMLNENRKKLSERVLAYANQNFSDTALAKRFFDNFSKACARESPKNK